MATKNKPPTSWTVTDIGCGGCGHGLLDDRQVSRRTIAIAAIGLILTLAGVVLLVLPGPGWLLIFIGLGVWATEFAWDRSLLGFVHNTWCAATVWLRRLPRGVMVLLISVGIAVIAGLVAYLLIR